MNTLPYGRYVWRGPRLARGWDDMQMIGRMKIHARREGVSLPKVWQLRKLVYDWERHDVLMPGQYARLLERIFSVPSNTLYSEVETR